jgi:hypothetical protein
MEPRDRQPETAGARRQEVEKSAESQEGPEGEEGREDAKGYATREGRDTIAWRAQSKEALSVAAA